MYPMVLFKVTLTAPWVTFQKHLGHWIKVWLEYSELVELLRKSRLYFIVTKFFWLLSDDIFTPCTLHSIWNWNYMKLMVLILVVCGILNIERRDVGIAGLYCQCLTNDPTFSDIVTFVYNAWFCSWYHVSGLVEWQEVIMCADYLLIVLQLWWIRHLQQISCRYQYSHAW